VKTKYFALIVVCSWLYVSAAYAIEVDALINGSTVAIGNISASNGYFQNNPATGLLLETGTFQLYGAFMYLMNDTTPNQFRWFQIVTADSDEPTWQGSGPALPYTDPPFDGWDYQRRDPKGDYKKGVPGDDQLPFYENNADYAQPTPTNTVVGGHNTTLGQSWTSDKPELPALTNANYQFQTYIVFSNPTLTNNHQFVVLEGYSWGGGYNGAPTTNNITFNGPTAIDPNMFNLTQLQTALNNDGFAGWTALSGATTPIPEPSERALAIIGIVCLAWYFRGRRHEEGADKSPGIAGVTLDT